MKHQRNKQLSLSYASIACSIILASSMLTGCGDNKFQKLSNSELQSKYSHCKGASGLSPGGAIICDNVIRECEARAKKKGRKMCY